MKDLKLVGSIFYDCQSHVDETNILPKNVKYFFF